MLPTVHVYATKNDVLFPYSLKQILLEIWGIATSISMVPKFALERGD